MTIRLLASTRFMAARSSSKATPSGRGSATKRLFTKRLTHCGVTDDSNSAFRDVKPTMTRATRLLPNISSDSSCRPRFTDVCTTCFAFFDVEIAKIMMSAAKNRYDVAELADSSREVMKYCVGSPWPSAYHDCRLLNPAMGTPMKFTRSLDANAMASAKVPISTITLNIPMPLKTINSEMRNIRTNVEIAMMPECPSTHSIMFSGRKSALPIPFTTMK